MKTINLDELFAKIDFRISPNAYSRADFQVKLIIQELIHLRKAKFNEILDVGGGYDGRYRAILQRISKKYKNVEIEKGSNVDIVGSVYELPLKPSTCDLVTNFMVLEHLNKPLDALKECYRVLEKKGYIALTTVQYWHTHSYPSDYFRYTKYGLEYLFEDAGFKIIYMWSHGGPFLVVFHAIELNIPNSIRTIYSICFYRLMDWLDWVFFKHEDKRRPNNDSVGWSVIAQKI